GAGADELADLGEPLTLESDGDRADRVDPGGADAPSLREDEADGGGVVDRRVGVRHGADGGEPTGGSGTRARRDRLLVLAAWLAQVDVDVDEPRRDDEAGDVDHLGPVGRRDVAPHTDDCAL